MKRRWPWIAALAVAAVAVVAWQSLRPGRTPATAGAPRQTSEPVAAPQAGRALELAEAEVFTVSRGDVVRSIPLSGTLRAVDQATVRAKVSGEIVEIAPREGTAVRAGQRIARIDPLDYEARVREREAQLRSAESQLAQAQRTRDHNRQLLERGFISQNAFDNLQSGYEVALAARDAATEQLAQARKALSDTSVIAPMTGIVAERLVQPGEKVSPDARIVTILDLSRIEIETQVPADEIGAIRVGQKVSLRAEGIESPLEGTVARIAPATAAGTRSVPVWIAIRNRDPRVRAGMFAQGELGVARRADVPFVPMAALRDAGGRSFVYRIADGRIEERTVVVGLRDPSARNAGGTTGAVEIADGLAVGDRIVGVNLGALRPGTTVRGPAAPGAPGAPGASGAPGAPGAPGASGDSGRR